MASRRATPTLSYPLAAAPDIIRSHQKDEYFTTHLGSTLTDCVRRLFGVRTAHAYAAETRTAAALVYFVLTTVVGNRTLGEEYADIVAVEGAVPGRRRTTTAGLNIGGLPGVGRRIGYVLVSVVLPYLFGAAMPRVRRTLRRLIDPDSETTTSTSTSKSTTTSRIGALRRYLATHIDGLTSPNPIHAVGLALFYFSGAYYDLGKRLFRLRYVFSRSVEPESAGRAGYEVLGVLLVLQLGVQAWLHVRDAVTAVGAEPLPETNITQEKRLHDDGGTHRHDQSTPPGPRFDLANPKVMPWMATSSDRRCTLCLDPIKDPGVTTCGHVFCWTCIVDWTAEKPECPLCRHVCLGQHVLALRA